MLAVLAWSQRCRAAAAARGHGGRARPGRGGTGAGAGLWSAAGAAVRGRGRRGRVLGLASDWAIGGDKWIFLNILYGEPHIKAFGK